MPGEGNNAGVDAAAAATLTAVADVGRVTDAAGVVVADVPCVSCGYDLRGLTAPGRCPECGFDLYTSILHHEARLIRQPPPDPRFARQVVEGAALSLAAFGLIILASLLWPALGQWAFPNASASRTPGRIVLLSLHCSAWVLSWYSVWKLTRKPPPGDTRDRGQAPAAARLGVTAYFLLPFVLAAAGREPGGLLVYLCLVLAVCGLVSLMPLFVSVGSLFQRGGRLSNESLLAAVVAPLAIVAAGVIGVGSGGISSLDLMLGLPVLPYGSPAIIFAVFDLSSRQSPDPILLAVFITSVWKATLFFRLMRRYREFARTVSAQPVTAASERPVSEIRVGPVT